MRDFGEVLLEVSTVIFTIMLFPVMYDYMITLDTSAWTFAGHDSVSIFLKSAFPFIFLIAGVLVPVAIILKRRR